jgi:N-acetylglucosaminyltransferase
MQRNFEVAGFTAPFVAVKRRADGLRGALEFARADDGLLLRLHSAFGKGRPMDSLTASYTGGKHPFGQDKGDDQNATDNRRAHQRGLHRGAAHTAHCTRDLESDRKAALALTLTVIVPSHNEQTGLHGTLRALLHQTVRPDRILVVDDGSTDNTAEVVQLYDVDVLTLATATGAKARAQNHALPYCTTDLVATIDADTVLAEDCVERMKEAFADPKVAIAAGNVQVLNVYAPRHPHTVIERGREIEYLYGFHFFRAIQNLAGAPQVCSGCVSMFRREALVEVGGFPDGTVAEDMSATFEMMIAGYRAVYVAGAECFVIDPKTPGQLRTQLWRWMSGYFQNVRTHWKEIIRHKKMLALWIGLGVFDVLSVPLVCALLVAAVAVGSNAWVLLALWLSIDLLVMLPVVTYAAIRRGYNPLRVIAQIPLVYVNRAYNAYYATKAMIVELILVPLGLAHSLDTFHKGH